jgi:hypothetical protein
VARHTDTRLKLLGNVLDGIRIIKMYAWELAYQTLINNARTHEITSYRGIALIRAVHFTLFLCGHGLILLLTFSAVVRQGETISLGDSFVVVSLILSL